LLKSAAINAKEFDLSGAQRGATWQVR